MNRIYEVDIAAVVAKAQRSARGPMSLSNIEIVALAEFARRHLNCPPKEEETRDEHADEI